MYESFGNLNRLLAWGHAKALENLLERFWRRGQFPTVSNPRNVLQALQERGRAIKLEQLQQKPILQWRQHPSWPARICRRLELLGNLYETAQGQAHKSSSADGNWSAAPAGKSFPKVCKMHFKTALEILQALFFEILEGMF